MEALKGFTALYDLSKREASFDFFTWMTNVKIRGATEIVFNTSRFKQGGWTDEERWERYNTILKPGPELAGLTWREGTDGEDIGDLRLGEIAALKQPDFERMRSVLPPGNDRYTVTLRSTKHKTFRNSNEAVWREFAKKIGARVIPDYADQPISLHERMAIYAGAKMNFGVTNGPLAMLFFTPYPFMMWDCSTNPVSWERHGIKVGTQLPWSLPGQSLVWRRPTPLHLIRAFNAQR